MKKIVILFFIFLIFIAINYVNFSNGADAHKGDPPVAQIGPDQFKIGNVILDKKKKEIYARGNVNMQTGLIEYLASWSENGKLHESVLKLDTKPSNLQVALLLLGIKPENNLKFQGDSTPLEGDLLEIYVEWESPDKKKKRVRAEELVYNKDKKKSMERTCWAFTGSEISNGSFIADVEGSIIATFRDPIAIINNPLPDATDDTIYFSNENLLPPIGTEILLTIKAPQQSTPENLFPEKLHKRI
ncbi:MAG: YdjY domain-containing protein [bacterium]